MDKLQEAPGVSELQQIGDHLVKMVREANEIKRRDIQSKIDMLRQESLEAKSKVYIIANP